MTDISRILDGLFADLGSDKALSVPALPAALPAAENLQLIDNSDTSHSSRTSRTENKAPEKTNSETPSNTHVPADGSRASSSYAGGAGSAGSAGSGAKTLAGSTPPFFPQDLEDAGSVGSESGPCQRPLLDLNRAAPQRSDWWTGPLMAEIDRAAAPPSGTTLPISPEKVRAGVERELRALADLGREGPDALQDAIAITRAKIRNSEALVERQVHNGRCHVCGNALDDTLPVISVLTGRPGAHLHLHSTCHAEHVQRMGVLVDRIMTAAGFGADHQGEVA